MFFIQKTAKRTPLNDYLIEIKQCFLSTSLYSPYSSYLYSKSPQKQVICSNSMVLKTKNSALLGTTVKKLFTQLSSAVMWLKSRDFHLNCRLCIPRVDRMQVWKQIKTVNTTISIVRRSTIFLPILRTPVATWKNIADVNAKKMLKFQSVNVFRSKVNMHFKIPVKPVTLQ